MTRSFTFFVATLALAGCTIEKAPATSPGPAGGPAPAPTGSTITAASTAGVDYLACPIGRWKVGDTEVKISSHPSKPGVYDVQYNGKQVAQPGAVDGQSFKVDMGQATGGQYTCAMQPDCQSMACGFAGQPPQVFKKIGT